MIRTKVISLAIMFLLVMLPLAFAQNSATPNPNHSLTYPGLSRQSQYLINNMAWEISGSNTAAGIILFLIVIFWLVCLCIAFGLWLPDNHGGRSYLGASFFGAIVVVLTLAGTMCIWGWPSGIIDYPGIRGGKAQLAAYQAEVAKSDSIDWQKNGLPLDSALTSTESWLSSISSDQAMNGVKLVTENFYGWGGHTFSGCRIIDKQLLLASAISGRITGQIQSGGYYEHTVPVELSSDGDARPVLADAQIAIWTICNGKQVTFLVPSKKSMISEWQNVLHHDWQWTGHGPAVASIHYNRLGVELSRISQNAMESINPLWSLLNDTTLNPIIDVKCIFNCGVDSIYYTDALRVRPAPGTKFFTPVEMCFAGRVVADKVIRQLDYFSALAKKS